MKEGPSADSQAGKVSVLLDPTEPPGVPQGPSRFPRLFIPPGPPDPPPSGLPEGGQEAVVVTPRGRQVPPADICGVEAPGSLQASEIPGNRDQSGWENRPRTPPSILAPHRAAINPQGLGAGCGAGFWGARGRQSIPGKGRGGTRQPRLTWIRLAAGVLLFSKCFCRCCSCTLRAKPEPRMPWGQEGTGPWLPAHTGPHPEAALSLSSPVLAPGSLPRPHSRRAERRRRCRAGRIRPPASGPATSAAPCPRSRWWSGSPARGHSSEGPAGRSPRHRPVPPSCSPPGAGGPRGGPSLPCPTTGNRRRWRTARWRPSRPGTPGRRRR